MYFAEGARADTYKTGTVQRNHRDLVILISSVSTIVSKIIGHLKVETFQEPNHRVRPPWRTVVFVVVADFFLIERSVLFHLIPLAGSFVLARVKGAVAFFSNVRTCNVSTYGDAACTENIVVQITWRE